MTARQPAPEAISALARVIWHTSRADEGTISATGANIVSQAALTFLRDAIHGDGPQSDVIRAALRARHRRRARRSPPARHPVGGMPMTATPAEVIVRPNGKPYRRRKPIAASEYETGDGTGLLVQGTLDVERAKGAFVGWLSSLDLLDVEPQRRWLRLVPWDAYGVGCGSSWVEDEVRGTPCVDWMPSW